MTKGSSHSNAYEISAPSPPRFSLIVSTIGRGASLAKLLDSLLAQACQDFEVIVVDQSRENHIRQIVESYGERLHSIRHVPCPQRGISLGRNLGWSYATGEFINFPDDDCWWPDGLLQQVTARFDADPALDALTTNVKTVSRCDTAGGLVDRNNLFRRSVEFSLFARRDRMGELRYDASMGVGAGTPWGADEGPDLMLRMLERGLKIEYFPEIWIYHPDPAELPLAELLRRTRGYARGRGYLFKKHRFSKLYIGRSLLRTAAGAILAALSLRWKQAAVRATSIGSTLTGYLSAGNPSLQTRATQADRLNVGANGENVRG